MQENKRSLPFLIAKNPGIHSTAYYKCESYPIQSRGNARRASYTRWGRMIGGPHSGMQWIERANVALEMQRRPHALPRRQR